MAQLVSGRIDGLRKAMAGPVIEQGDPGYDEARRVWNAAIDRRPAAIAQCLSSTDAAAAVSFAVRNDLEIAVRGGAHSVPGASVVDDGLMIDLSRLNHVIVDPQSRRARVGGGALLGDLDAAAQAHGLAVPAGMVSHTGVGGLTLGGGMGWLTRQAGLSIDNLRSVEIVTADGQIRRASADEHPDLFWAVRGGGGNFGVVTEFEFRLHEVGPVIQLGLLFWPLEQGGEALRLARDVIGTLPRDVNIGIVALSAPPAPFVPEQFHHQPGYALVVVGFGSADAHGDLLARLRAALPPLWEFVSPMPYVALQQMVDEPNAWGFFAYDKGAYVEQLSDEVIDLLTEHVPRKASPLSTVIFYRLDGAYSEVGEDDTAFSGGRSPRFAAFIIAICPTPELLSADREWVRSLWAALQSHAPATGTYVNALSEPDDDRVRAAYGPEKYARLARIKSVYDAGNVFHRNANVKPSPAVARPRQPEG